MLPWIVLLVALVGSSRGQGSEDSESGVQNFKSYFSPCRPGDDGFDDCMAEALNAVRPFFKTGVFELKIPRVDPFLAEEVVRTMKHKDVSHHFVLRNVEEKYWSNSVFTDFRFEPELNLVKFTQYFPEFYIGGTYEHYAKAMKPLPNDRQIDERVRQGEWYLKLTGLVRTTTILKPQESEPFSVLVDFESVMDLQVYSTNIMRDHRIMERMIHSLVHSKWKEYFPKAIPHFNALYSDVATEIFNNEFKNFDFENFFEN